MATKPKPPERAHWARFDWGFDAVCFGASPVASALDLPQERDFPKNRIHTTTHPPVEPVEQDISTCLLYTSYWPTSNFWNRSARMKELRFDAADGVRHVAFAFDPKRRLFF